MALQQVISLHRSGVTTRKGDQLFVHIFNHDAKELHLPLSCKVKEAFIYDTKQPLKVKRTKEGVTLLFEEVPSGTDYIVVLKTK